MTIATQVSTSTILDLSPVREKDELLLQLINGSSRTQVENFLIESKARESNFTARFPFYSISGLEQHRFRIPISEQSRWDCWCRTEEGREIIGDFSHRLCHLLFDSSPMGYPGHDRRHILLKDPLAALQHVTEDHISPTNGLFVLGALAHDIGRLPEPALLKDGNGTVTSRDHAVMSFGIVEQLLERYEAMPSGLKDHLLFAVLEHQSGCAPMHFLSQGVQRADRLQLVGPEAILRMTAYHSGVQHLEFFPKIIAGVPDPLERVTENSLIGQIDFYMRNLFPLTGAFGEEHATEFKIVSAKFLWLASPVSLRKVIFAPEIARDNGKIFQGRKELSEEIWSQCKEGPSSEQKSRMDRILAQNKQLETVLLESITANGTASLAGSLAIPLRENDSPITVQDSLLERISSLSEPERECLRTAFAYSVTVREQYDESDRDIIYRVLSAFPDEKSAPHIVARAVERALI